jgi:hypothetical protein
VPYSDSPPNKSQSAPILIKIRCTLTCFGPAQSLDALGWGSLLTVLGVYSKILQTHCTLKAFASHSHVSLISISLVSHPRSHLILISVASASPSSRSHRILISLSSRAHLTLLSLSTCDSSEVVQDFVHQP